MKIIEKYLKYGYDSLNQKEILKIILYLSGYKKTDEKINELLSYYNSYENIFQNSNIKIKKKLNQKFLILNKLLQDSSYNFILDKMSEDNNLLESSDIVVEFFKRKLAFKNKEYFYILMLNNHYKYLTHKLVSKGTINKATIFIRELIELAIEFNAKNIIICHNHPSGRCMPSIEDENITKNIKKKLSVLEIPLIDHIIIGKYGYYSFAKEGKI